VRLPELKKDGKSKGAGLINQTDHEAGTEMPALAVKIADGQYFLAFF
jgi:hypothetical protein